MSHPMHAPRAEAILARFETWSDAGPVRAVGVKVLVTVGGPLVALAGVAMLVLPGPGLVVIALGVAMLALEYSWARRLLTVLGHSLAWAKNAALPRDGSAARKSIGVLGMVGFFVVTTLLTGTATTYVGAHLVF